MWVWLVKVKLWGFEVIDIIVCTCLPLIYPVNRYPNATLALGRGNKITGFLDPPVSSSYF